MESKAVLLLAVAALVGLASGLPSFIAARPSGRISSKVNDAKSPQVMALASRSSASPLDTQLQSIKHIMHAHTLERCQYCTLKTSYNCTSFSRCVILGYTL